MKETVAKFSKEIKYEVWIYSLEKIPQEFKNEFSKEYLEKWANLSLKYFFFQKSSNKFSKIGTPSEMKKDIFREILEEIFAAHLK